MKPLLITLSFITCVKANAGYFVEKSVYSPKFLVIGRGRSLLEARQDALAAVPEEKNGVHYERDPMNSPQSQCTGGGAPDQSLESCGAADWQMVIPLVRVER